MGPAWNKTGVAFAALSPAFAFSAVPAQVTTLLGAMKTDALQVAAMFLVAIIAVSAFKFIRRGL